MNQTKATMKTVNVRVDQIKRSPYQPRLTFDLEDIRGSILRDGILVPLTVRWRKDYYELIDGERRLRLAIELGNKDVPCTVIDVDDDTARRMEWKVNTLRQEYTPKEKAYYFKNLRHEYGMTVGEMARECDVSTRDVKAYLNVLKLPEEYQQMVWDREIPIRNIRELEKLFEGVTRVTREKKPEVFDLLDRSAREKHFGAEQIREAIRPYLTRLREAQIGKAKETLAELEPEIRLPETPEELERAAVTLRKEARRKQEELSTPEEKAGIRAKEEARKQRIEESRKRREEAQRRKINDEATKRAKELVEMDRLRIEREARERMQKEILASPELMRDIVKRYQRAEAERQVKSQPKAYQTLEVPLQAQYHHQRIWNLKQLVGRDLSLKGKTFNFDFITVGYSQKTMEGLCTSLERVGATLLVDVRKNPRSMYRSEFNKSSLAEELRKHGIDYEHMPELGIPREIRNRAYKGEITPSELFELYGKQILTNEKLEKLQSFGRAHSTFAIMCTEVDPTMCHRHRIALALTERGKIGYDL